MSDLPDGWTWGLGEANRPLSERGYYMHYAQRRLWANQHVDRFIECRIDTLDMPPSKHVIDIRVFEERDEEIREVERIDSATERVIDPGREASQRDAERRAHDRAMRMLRELEIDRYR